MDAKPAATLTAGLLARKGLARPAMRRQTVAGLGPRPMIAAEDADDLGWNDMGHDVPSSPSPLSPVALHIAALQETLVRPVAPAPAPVAEKPAPAPEPAVRKSAFTLRIDAERHLRLRLLSAVSNQSAQSLMIGALDALLAQHPDIDALAADPKVRRGTSE